MVVGVVVVFNGTGQRLLWTCPSESPDSPQPCGQVVPTWRACPQKAKCSAISLSAIGTLNSSFYQQCDGQSVSDSACSGQPLSRCRADPPDYEVSDGGCEVFLIRRCAHATDMQRPTRAIRRHAHATQHNTTPPTHTVTRVSIM